MLKMGIKLEGSDIWEDCLDRKQLEKEKIKYAEDMKAAQKAAQQFVLSNLENIKKIVIEYEDGNYEGTMADLKSAINTARLEDLQKFPKTKQLAYESHAYLRVVLRKG